MKRYLISELAKSCGLSRSTLLYYDRIGLLSPSGRMGAEYRYYTEKDRRKLSRIRRFRQAGLTLKEICSVFSGGGSPKAALLEKRLRETSAEIVDLRKQQRLLTDMLTRIAAKAPGIVDKAMWVEMLKAAGLDEKAMGKWHAEFERRSPGGHQEFLVSLHLPDEEVARIREWSRKQKRD